MNKFIPIIAVILIALPLVEGKIDWGNVLSRVVDVWTGVDEEPKAMQLPEPDRYIEQANSIRKLLIGKPEQARACSQLWWGLADCIYSDQSGYESSGPQVTNTKQVRESNEKAGKLTFAGRVVPDKAILAEANDGLIEAMGGKENKPLTDDSRKDIVDYFKAIAWGAQEAINGNSTPE